VVALHQQHHRRRHDHHDVEEFDPRHPLPCETDHAQHADEQRRDEEEHPEELPHGRVPDQAVERQLLGHPAAQIHQQRHQQGELAQNGDDRDGPMLPLREHDLEHEEEQRQQRQRQLGEQGRPTIVGGGGLKKGEIHRDRRRLGTRIGGRLDGQRRG
jgi:hypothetical protein